MILKVNRHSDNKNTNHVRFNVSKHISLSLHLAIPYMNFNNGRIDDNLGSDYSYPMTFAGIDLGTGLVFRF